MAEGNHGACNYEPYTSDLPTGDVAIPSRYRTTRRGKRRQTTLVKRKSVLEQNPSEMKYKIASDDASTSSVDENYEVDSITSSLEETLTLVMCFWTFTVLKYASILLQLAWPYASCSTLTVDPYHYCCSGCS